MEAVRAATIFAYDLKAYQRWTRARGEEDRMSGVERSPGLAGADLERVIFAMSVANSDIVEIRRG